MRFIEMISKGGTQKAQRETAPWYAVLERAEFTENGRLVKTFGTRQDVLRTPVSNDTKISASGGQNARSRHASGCTEAQQLKIRSNCRARNQLQVSSGPGALPDPPDGPYLA